MFLDWYADYWGWGSQVVLRNRPHQETKTKESHWPVSYGPFATREQADAYAAWLMREEVAE